MNIIKEKDCGHIAVDVSDSRGRIYDTDFEFLSAYPTYLLGPGGDIIPVASVDRDEYPEDTYYLPEDVKGKRVCTSQSYAREYWEWTKRSNLVLMGVFRPKPIMKPLKVQAIEVEPIGSVEGFCFQGDDHGQFVMKSAIFATSMAVDAGITAISVMSLGAATPLYALNGAYTAYLDQKVEVERFWPCHPDNEKRRPECDINWVPFI